MHLPLLLAAAVAGLDPSAQALAPPAPAPLAADPCAGARALPPEPACGATPLCAARERVRVSCELRDAIRARYVFLDAKRTLLGGFDPLARLDACVEAERAIEREPDPLRFYDRIRACTGAFQDGHLIVTVPGRVPQVALGIELRRAGAGVVVASREPGLRALVGDAAADAVPLGAEVVAVDGVPVADAVAALAREVPGSSPAARRWRAVEALTRRDFAHPEQRTATLTLALADGGRRTVELPWWVSPGAERSALAAPWAKRVRLPSTDRLAWFEDALRHRRGAIAEGTPSWSPLLPPGAAEALTEYADDGGRVAVRLGEVERGVGHPFCYVQILSFHSEGLTGPAGHRPFAPVVADFVRRCGEQRRDVVLDLRHNEGGYLDHSTAIAEALAPAGAPETPSALLLRATERNEAVYRERAATWDDGDDVLAPRHVLDALEAARAGGESLTPAFVSGAGPVAGGFPGRVIALTSPACMSACDRLAALLKGSGRAVLVGSPTEGAGGSQQEAPGLPSRWTDSSRLLTVAIPNAAFGVRRAPGGMIVSAGAAADAAPAPGRRGEEVPAPVFFESFGIENHPVEPDVRYEPRLEDVTDANRGWLQQVDAILSGSPLAAVKRTRAPFAILGLGAPGAR